MDDTRSQDDGAQGEAGDPHDNVVPSHGYQLLPVVGIGGSAGAVPALRRFFEAVPGATGMAYVVVLHLSPEHESALAGILQPYTPMPVVQVRERCRLEPDHVYVVPPRRALRTQDGFLQLDELPVRETRHVAVDLFFRTLADTHGPRAVAVVLSGVDGDGAIGVKRIKERGGLAIVQDPDQAEHGGMPRAAIATGMVDWILPVQDMPSRLLDYQRLENLLQLPAEQAPAAAPEPGRPAGAHEESALRQVMAFVHTRTGRDFSGYKRATVLRRLGRRMQVNGVDTLDAYLLCLRTRPGEAAALVQDLLVSVTHFFRDPDCFAALGAQIPALLRDKGPTDTVRVWIAACATGEEAYSVAMLLLEHARQMDAPPLIQVFASDLDAEAVRSARDGVYTGAIEGDVSPERLRRFFTQDHRGYRVRREVREMVLFAVHDVLRDAPFSRVDLITCRNLLIYLTRDTQQHVLDVFGFALQPGGLLFLGASESVDEGSDVFAVVDKKHRLYAQRGAPRPGVLVLPVRSDTLALALDAQQAAQAGPVLSAPSFARPPVPAPPRSAQAFGAGSWAELHLRLLESVAPPSILVDAAGDIVHMSPSAGRYLHHPGGEPSRSLLRAIRPELRVELRTALYQAGQGGAAVEAADPALPVRVHVVPFGRPVADFMLVTLRPRDDPHPGESAPSALAPETVTPALEREIERLRKHLHDTVEQYEVSAEDLKASNEELQAMNEEMRSAAEELETSREELQSINEELITVNQELRTKVEELAQSNADLHNLMGATAIATVFLDRELRIKRFTPAAIGLFTLIAADVGRPLSDLATRLQYAEMDADARQVLASLQPVEREVGAAGGGTYLVRLLPYRTANDHIGGVVMTCVDITERKRGQQALRDSEELLRLVVENTVEYAIFSTDPDMRITSWNTGAQRLLGHTAAQALAQHFEMIFTPEDRGAGVPLKEVETALKEGRAGDDREHLRKDGSTFWANGALMPMRDGKDRLVGFVKILRDQSRAREAQRQLERNRAQLQAALEQEASSRAALEAADAAKDRFLAVLSHELRNPLASIHTAVQVLQSGQSGAGERAHAGDIVQRQAAAMKVLLDDLLDVSRLSLGRLVIRREPVAVHALVQAAVEATQAAIEEGRHTLVVTVPPALPDVVGDPLRLGQVLANLLVNAAKYTPKGGRIALQARAEGLDMVFEVSDNGVGIAPERLEGMFEMFSQDAASEAAAGHGLGIGLALVRAIVELHGGSVTGRSGGPGTGCTFTVRLPARRVFAGLRSVPASVPESAQPAARPPGPGGASPAVGKVVVADDNRDAAWGLGKVLEEDRWEVHIADGGLAAMELAELVRPQVMVLDIGMPDMNGLEVAREVRQRPWGREVMLIAATGWGQPADRMAASMAGFDAHLVKPVDLAELRRLMRARANGGSGI